MGGAREPDPIEYDLDNEDEDWLKQYNLGRNKLNDMLFEKMLWKLELVCAEATDSALTAAGTATVAVTHMSLLCPLCGVCFLSAKGYARKSVALGIAQDVCVSDLVHKKVRPLTAMIIMCCVVHACSCTLARPSQVVLPD